MPEAKYTAFISYASSYAPYLNAFDHGHLDALGHRIRRHNIEALHRSLRRFRHTLFQVLDPLGRPPRLDLDHSIAASVGVLLA